MSNTQKEFEQLLTEINEILNEIKNEQINQKKIIEEKHKVNMKKLSRIIEFTEIQDMTNQVFEKRIASIEKVLYETLKP